MKKNAVKSLFPILFVLPGVAMIFSFMIFPLCEGFIMSLFKWSIMGDAAFIGIENYQKLFFNNEVTGVCLRNNALFSAFTTLGTVGIGMALAILMQNKIRGWKLFRMLFYIPVTLSSVVVSMLWIKIYDPNAGLIALLLERLGFAALRVEWLGDPNLVIWSVILVTVWQYAGYTMVFFIAALQNIPEELYEAARIDGVNRWGEIRHIMLPLTRTVIVIVTMLQLISSFKVFDQVWVMSTGGPGYSSHVLGVYLYTEAFRKFDLGFAEAIAVLMFSIIFILSMVYLKASSFEESSYEY